MRMFMSWKSYMDFRTKYNELPEWEKQEKPLGRYFCELFGIHDFTLVIMDRYYECCDYIELNFIDPDVLSNHFGPCFEKAAARLQQRWRRRFRKIVGYDRWDQTSIKDRWYRRQTCAVVRERLGKQKVL